MTTAAPSTALATIQPAFTDAERLALAGYLAGYRGLTREAYALDLRQFTSWCRARSLSLFSVRRADIESFARQLEANGRARATVTRRLCTIAGFYAQLIDHAWDDIKEAAAEGLAMPNPYGVPCPVLDTVAVVSTEKPSETKDWHHIQIPDAPAHVRVEESGNVIDIMHHYSLSYHELHAPDKEAIKEWATRARQFELSVTLRRFVRNAARHAYMANYLHQADPDGWGQRRFVVFGSAARAVIPERWGKADLENTVRVDHKPIDRIEVMIFRIAGGPYVRRPADLSLGGRPPPTARPNCS